MVSFSKSSGPTVWTLLAGLAAAALPAVGAAAAPTISGYAATNPRGVAIFSAPPGAPLLIEGANMGSSGTVAFNGVPALPPASWTPTEILVTVPAASSYPFIGPVTVTANGQTVSGPDFTICPPPPPRAVGTWSVIALPQRAGKVYPPGAEAVDTAGNLYVADWPGSSLVDFAGRIQQRDAQGNWSVTAIEGDALGQVSYPSALAVDAAGSLYAADRVEGHGRIQKRGAQANWSDITPAAGLGWPTALAVDMAGNLYAAELSPIPVATGGYTLFLNWWIDKRDAQGNWSMITIGQDYDPVGLAVDMAGNIYTGGVSPWDGDGLLRQRDTQGGWSVIAGSGGDLGRVGGYPLALAVDTAGNLYVADGGHGIQKRDAQGNWTVVADPGTDLGQVSWPSGLAVDAAGNLYVADTGNNRVQEFAPLAGP